MLPIERPGKIVCVGLNYRDHAEEQGADLPEAPLLFAKWPSSLIGPGEAIVIPPIVTKADYEAELGVVIGRRATRVAAGDALDYVRGYTCVNDVTVRDLQKRDGQWTRAKGFDTFCPIGPRLVEGLDPSALAIRSRLNGETRQDSSTSDLIFDVPRLIEFISAVMTLETGDVISTGTPSGVGPMVPGDRIEVDIEGIGVLANVCVACD